MKFDLSGVSVFIGMPAHRDIPTYTVASLMDTASTLRSQGIRCELQSQSGSSIVQSARNMTAYSFLESDYTHLFLVDSDMKWRPESFLRLLSFATAVECVGASYPMRSDPIQFCLNVVDDLDKGFETNEYGLIPIKGFGLGFTCVQRKVMEELAAKARLILLPNMLSTVAHEIFRTDIVETSRATKLGAAGEFRGEDMCFFHDVGELGYTVWMDPSIKLGHIGQKVFEASFSEMLTEDSNTYVQTA